MSHPMLEITYLRPSNKPRIWAYKRFQEQKKGGASEDAPALEAVWNVFEMGPSTFNGPAGFARGALALNLCSRIAARFLR